MLTNMKLTRLLVVTVFAVAALAATPFAGAASYPPGPSIIAVL